MQGARHEDDEGMLEGVSSRPSERNLSSSVRMLIAVRLIVVTTLLLAARIIQFIVNVQSTENISLPIGQVNIVAGTVYAMTLLYIALDRRFDRPELNLSIQFAGDLIIETVLVYFTGGLDSPFSFLYLVSIITASMLLYRRGGLITASGSVILYGGLADLMYYRILPLPPENLFSPTSWSSTRLYVNLATNFAGFYATALLTSIVSERLRRTFRELDVNRQNLAELQALNQNVVGSIPSGLITLTQAGTISFINPAGMEMLHGTQSSWIGRHLTEVGFFTPDEWERVRDEIAEKQVVRGEKEEFVRGSEVRHLGFAMTPLQTLDGSKYGLTLIFQDLTEVKELEAQLRLKDRMAAVGELAAGIAHEIRNPLAAIAGSVQVLRKSASLTPQEARLMSIILKESDRLNKSIADFLRFVKPQERLAEPFDVAAGLTETLDLLENSAELRPDHRIERAIVPASFIIPGDADQIRQVFWNLARNAIQAMPAGGSLRVSTAAEEGFYRIVFADDGGGMSDGDQRRLFQPFRTSFPSGTGLGMAISFKIIQEHGGTIGVDSAIGRGCAITLTLPILNSGRGTAFFKAVQ